MGFIITCIVFFIMCAFISFLAFVEYQWKSIFYNDYFALFVSILFFCMALICFGGIIFGLKYLL